MANSSATSASHCDWGSPWGSVEILANLNWRLQFGIKPREAVKIVVNDRLLDPLETQIIDRVAAVQCFGEIEALVEIDHQTKRIADRDPNSVDGSEIISRILPPKPKFESGETSLIAQFNRLFGDLFRVPEPKPIAVVAFTGPTVPPRNTQSGRPAAFARASQAAISSPETAIMARP
jgi:hypothetical protein